MLALFRSNIDKIQFPHTVRGPGIFTPVNIYLTGWGFVSVSYPEIPKSKPFKKFKKVGEKLISLDVPKSTKIKVTFWNIFGFSSTRLITPSNNTDISNVVAPKLPEVEIPTSLIYTPEIKSKSFNARIAVSTTIQPIKKLASQLRSNFSIFDKYLNTYKLNRTVKIQSSDYPKASHRTNYKLKIDFNNIHLNNEAVSNSTKGSES